MIQYNYTFDPDTRTLTPSGDPVTVKGDTNVVQIIFTMLASYEGLALSSYVWRVYYKIAMNTKLEEVRFHQFTDQTTEGENLVLTWTVTNSVTEFAGHLGFALSGTLTDTGGNVTNRINSIPAYERIEPTIGGGSYTEDDAEIEGIKDFLVGIQEAAEAAQAAAETAAAEAEASAARVEQIADELEPYKSLAIVESASGDPATFTDGSNGVPMKSVSVGIEPVQDLNGYEYPWVGGAGKNLLDLDAYVAYITQNRCTVTKTETGLVVTATNANGYTIPKSGKTREASVKIPSGTTSVKIVMDVTSTTTSTCTGFVYEYAEDGSSASDPNSVGVIGTGHQEITYNIRSSDTKYLFFRVGSTQSGVTVTYSNMMIINGTETDTSYSPYSNVCPISGWDEVKVTRTGKNLLENTLAQSTVVSGVTWTKNSDGTVTANGTASGASQVVIPISSDYVGDYYFTGCPATGSANTFDVYVWDYTDNGRAKQWNGTTSSVSDFNMSLNQVKLVKGHDYRIRLRVNTGTTANNLVFKPMLLMKTETSTDYEPYQGQTYPISLTSAGTVYGGTLYATTGELVVDRKMVDLGSLTWSSISAGRLKSMAVSSQIVKPANNVKTTAISDKYESFANSVLASDETYIGMSVATDGGIVVRTVSGNPEGIVVYPLATPLTYTLTPTQITSLLGTNHVWADCGEVAVEYVADTKMYIDKIVASL